MRTALIFIAIVAAVIGMVIAIMLILGSRLPRNHVATRSAQIDRPAGEIYRAIRDVGRYPEWRKDVRSIEITETLADGRVRFREDGSNGTVNYELSEDVPGRRLRTTILDTDLGYAGSWTYDLEPNGDRSTVVTITENGEVSNLFFRFMSHYVFGQTSGLEKYLDALKNI